MNNIHSNKLDELLLCFDNKGNEIEPKGRQTVHKKPLTLWHAVASVWLLNPEGKILCSKRSRHVEGNPNKWQTYFGGHVKAGDNFLDTLKREVEEEIGLDVKREEILLVDSGKREDVMHAYKNYVILFKGDISKLNFADGEVAEAKWLSFDDYCREKNDNPGNWCNSMHADQYRKAVNVLGI